MLGGIEILVTSMMKHVQVRHVQECAVAALSNLSAGDSANIYHFSSPFPHTVPVTFPPIFFLV
jgi:hypothetical protein